MGKEQHLLPKGINELLRFINFIASAPTGIKILSSLLSFQSDQYIDASSNNPIDGFALKIETC
jgi:hypothetical protein